MRSHAKDASAPSTHGENARFSLAVLTAMLVCAGALLGLSASAATAATAGQSYGYTNDIGTPSSLANREFNGVAVSTGSGNVFVVNQNEFSLEQFDSSGTSTQATFSSPWLVAPVAVAAASDGNSFFVANGFDFFGGPAVVKYTSDGASPPNYTADPAWVPATAPSSEAVSGLAVDPTSGEVYVSIGTAIDVFDATSGALVSSIDGSTTQGGFTTQSSPKSLAIGLNGDVYVVVGNDRVEHLGPDGHSKGSLTIPVPENSYAPSGIAVNPQNGDVAVELLQGGDTVIKVYTAANDLKETIRVPAALAADATGEWAYSNAGLAFAADGSRLYVDAKNGTAHVFTLGTRPGVDPPTASQVVADGATLSADVATNGASSNARIEYCLATDPCDKYLASISTNPADRDYDATLDLNSPFRNPDKIANPWVRLPMHANLSDPDHDVISDDVTGLPANTSYLLRTYAINNADGVEAISATGSFTTALVPPEVETGTASSVSNTTADVTGTIGTFGGQTTYHFEYGLTTNYGSQVPASAEGIAGSARTPRAFSQTIKSLQPGMTYHFRLVATNAAGTTAGNDNTFTTLGVDQVAPVRGYEQVTSPNKGSLSLFANWGFQASPDGSAITYSVSETAADAASAAQASRYLARRGNSDWSGQKPLDPPLTPTRGILNAVTQAVSEDSEHTLVISQKALAPGAVEGGANIYINDVDTGGYALVGTAPGTAYSQMVGPNTLNTFIGGAPDLSWVVLISRYPLLPGAPQVAMYKWTRASGLSVISLLPGDVAPTGAAWFQKSVRYTNRLVSDDGDTVAFSLTNGEGGVYRRSGNTTIPVSVSQISPGSAQPGTVEGISREGRFVFFNSNVQLTDDATDPGAKMYRYDASSDTLEYLGPQDGTDDGALDVLGIGGDGRTVYFNSNGHFVVWRDGQLSQVDPAALRADTNISDGVDIKYGFPSPNGRYFAWVAADETVHLYDAVANTQVCISCLPGGGKNTGGRLGGLPDRNLSNRFPQVVTDDGHAFFDTKSALISADHNATSDVYEYFQGRLTLISPGDLPFAATLADITPDAGTVFFTTAEGLVGQDTDQSYDLYAARIGGGFAAQNPPRSTACANEACQGAIGAPPAQPSLGSANSGSSAPSKRAHKPRCTKNAHRVRRNGKTRCAKKKSKHVAKTRDAKHNRGASR